MILLTEYSVLHYDGFYFAVTQNKPTCPDCDSVMSVRDSRRRSVKDSAGNTYVFKLRRLYCSSCNQLHLEIPDCIQPNKHYFARTIAGVQSGEIDCCAADEKTLQRWRKGEYLLLWWMDKEHTRFACILPIHSAIICCEGRKRL